VDEARREKAAEDAPLAVVVRDFEKESKKSLSAEDDVNAATPTPTSRWGNVYTHLKHVLREVAENHHILNIVCSTKVDFPRRDRALCFLAYTLMMFVMSGAVVQSRFCGYVLLPG
jgi:hypothetical protein